MRPPLGVHAQVELSQNHRGHNSRSDQHKYTDQQTFVPGKQIVPYPPHYAKAGALGKQPEDQAKT